MEMIIGCIFLTVLLLILAIFCKNVTLTVKIEHKLDTYTEIKDTLYDKDGNPVNKEDVPTIDDVLKVVNSMMLDTEVNNDE